MGFYCQFCVMRSEYQYAWTVVLFVSYATQETFSSLILNVTYIFPTSLFVLEVFGQTFKLYTYSNYVDIVKEKYLPE